MNENIALGFIISFILITILLLCTKKKKEKFTSEFANSFTTEQLLHKTQLSDGTNIISLLQKGNNGETIILLHHAPLDSFMWIPLFEEFQRRGLAGKQIPNLIAYDLRGFGSAWQPVKTQFNDTDPKNRAWSLEQFTNDFHEIYNKLVGSGQIKLCGFGFGGFIAQKVALTYPELISKLYILQTATKPRPRLYFNIQRLSDWATKNSNIYYLTNQQSLVNETLCNWFYLPPNQCSQIDPKYTHPTDQLDEYKTSQYEYTEKMLREGSTTSYLQSEKLLTGIDLSRDWKNAHNIKFSIHILSATDDPLAPPNIMTETYSDIYNNNRELQVSLDIVEGRHGFTMMHPGYIADILN